jgi:pimeloyl-ACP methyl ester carboxylesterase
MSQRTCYIAINGIRTNPGDAEGWTDRFVTWINTRLPDGVVAEKFEYYCSALLRRVRQRERADEIAKKVGYYRRAGYRIVLVGHSNGCDLIARVLEACGAEIDAAHLISPAADEDDFADAIREGLIRRVHIYGSHNDGALLFASITRPLIGWLGLGYGSMGLRGQEFASLFPEVAKDHSKHTYGHSTWLQRGPNFEALMQLIYNCDLEDQRLKSLSCEQTPPPPRT